MNKIFIKTKLILVALLSVITAFCGVISLAPTTVHAEGSIDLTGEKWMVRIVEFNGTIRDVEFDGKPFGYDGRTKQFTLGGNEDLIYEYYDENDVKLDGAPKTVGNYYVKVVAPEGATLTGEFEESKDFTIEKATLVNPWAEFEKELDIVKGKQVIKVTPSSTNYYSDAVITGTLEAGVVGTYEIKLEFTLTDKNFQFDVSQPQKTQYKYEITDNGNKFVITYTWTVETNVERSFKNDQNKTVVVDENNTLPEGIAASSLKVVEITKEDVDFEKYNDVLKEQFSDKKERFGTAYTISFMESDDKEIEIKDGSKFLVTIPVPEKLSDYEKDNIKVMLVKKDGGVEFISINDFVDETWTEGEGKNETKVTIRSIDFETAQLGTFVVMGLTQLPDSVGSWWQIALIASLAIIIVLAIVFFVVKPKKRVEPSSNKESETEEENKNE